MQKIIPHANSTLAMSDMRVSLGCIKLFLFLLKTNGSLLQLSFVDSVTLGAITESLICGIIKLWNWIIVIMWTDNTENDNDL